MKKITLLLTLLLTISVNASAQTEARRIERLSGLARVWGAVKFFHPYPAYREIDWDKALIETIPKVDAAKSPEEYAAAINSMLAALADKNTRAEVFSEQPKAENKSAIAAAKEPFQFENGVLTIDVFRAATAMSQVGSQSAADRIIGKTLEPLPQAKAVILDLRSPDAAPGDDVGFFTDYFTRIAAGAMLDKTVALSSLRYRMHNGYESQTENGSSGYYSAFVTTAPKMLAGKNPGKTPPLVVLVNENSAQAEIIGGLQSANAAYIIQDGAPAEELGAATTTLKLPENVRVKMRTAELVNADGTINLTADEIAPRGEAMNAARQAIRENKFPAVRPKTAASFTAQVNKKEKTYAEMEFPEKEYRLLALFRFWNVINYFFPYKDLTDTDWNEILPKYIPQFEADRDAPAYRLTAGKMVAEIKDSHGFFQPPRLKNPPQFYFPPTVEAYAENQTYIRGVLDETSSFKIGDAVLEVDGVPIAKLLEQFTVRVAASTTQAMMRQVHGYGIFRGAKDSKAVFKVRGLDGKERTIETIRNVAPGDERFAKFYDRKRKTPMVSILPSGFAYVDLDRLTLADVDKMFETIRGAPAVIFDMRGYPNQTGFEIAPRLTTKKSPIGALFSNPIAEATTFNSGESAAVTYSFAQRLAEPKGEIYTGKIVMLIDENAQSQAEHTALAFEAARPDITFIGTASAGANGDITQTVLPGNIVVTFSGHSVRHAEGRQLQRVGIQPTVKVAPTIRGIVEGKDEILDAAVKFLQTRRQ